VLRVGKVSDPNFASSEPEHGSPVVLVTASRMPNSNSARDGKLPFMSATRDDLVRTIEELLSDLHHNRERDEWENQTLASIQASSHSLRRPEASTIPPECRRGEAGQDFVVFLEN
jgi:hypothetical protein